MKLKLKPKGGKKSRAKPKRLAIRAEWVALVVALAVVVAGMALMRPKLAASSLVAGPDPCKTVMQVDQIDCYDKYFNDIIRNHGGAKAAIERLGVMSKQDPGVEGLCHPIIHTIGRNAYKFYGSVEAATKYGNELCWSGYYHGIMEAYMAQFDDKQLLAKMPDICHQTPGHPYSFDYYNCLHGLGHGVTIRFENDIMKSLPYCDVVRGDWEQESCYSGAFMQNIVVDGITHKSVNLRADDPVYPCDAVAERQKPSCYLMVTSNILKVDGYDYAKAFATCDTVEANYIATCYQSMGRDISGNSLLDQAKIVPLCDMGAEAMRSHCVVGAVKNAVFNDRGVARANQLCNAVDSRYKSVCLSARDEASSTL